MEWRGWSGPPSRSPPPPPPLSSLVSPCPLFSCARAPRPPRRPRQRWRSPRRPRRPRQRWRSPRRPRRPRRLCVCGWVGVGGGGGERGERKAYERRRREERREEDGSASARAWGREASWTDARFPIARAPTARPLQAFRRLQRRAKTFSFESGNPDGQWRRDAWAPAGRTTDRPLFSSGAGPHARVFFCRLRRPPSLRFRLAPLRRPGLAPLTGPSHSQKSQQGNHQEDEQAVNTHGRLCGEEIGRDAVSDGSRKKAAAPG